MSGLAVGNALHAGLVGAARTRFDLRLHRGDARGLGNWIAVYADVSVALVVVVPRRRRTDGLRASGTSGEARLPEDEVLVGT